ncbi:hypothetical protein F5X98DRAFT_356139 [Xylaria grammica]|nr:hypothetical protein F5X98DRAFT_356139 [Xylaria grammica]
MIRADGVAWLREQLRKISGPGRQVLVATHHAPCSGGTPSPRLTKNAPRSSAFVISLLPSGGCD